MIARGDLAVEVGFERLSEVVRQILALCEAAHVPAIWATQVLETLAKTGAPSRAEVTDAAAAQRAECVMLNKGPYILDAIRALGRHPRVRGRGATEEPDPDATHSLLGRAIEPILAASNSETTTRAVVSLKFALTTDRGRWSRSRPLHVTVTVATVVDLPVADG